MIEGFTCTYSLPTHADGTVASDDYTNNFQFTHSDCIVTSTSTIASTSPSVLNTMTNGEILIAFFNFLILALLFFKVITDRLIGIRRFKQKIL